jgi:prephenate dehydrogenase
MSEDFSKVGIIGTGLMGGSLALALISHPGVDHVVCYDISPETRKEARELCVCDEVVESAAEAAHDSDLIFIATPVGSIEKTFSEVSGSLKDGTIVTDVGSVKLPVIAAIEEILPEGIHYVGGHPMAGSEQEGVGSARADLYRDCYYILTPTDRTDADAFRRLHGLLTDIGSRVISMDPESHDRAMATISHVPHLLSLILMEIARKKQEKMKNLFTVAASGFRDMTRIAASSPDLWTDICMENSDFILAGLVEYGEGIDELIDVLKRSDRDRLRELFMAARRARNDLSVKKGLEIEELYEVTMPVPDQPGVISKVSTAVGSLGINIEDIGIVHPLEGETGILNLKILGHDKALKVNQELATLGYGVRMRRA